jgi:glycogen synthase
MCDPNAPSLRTTLERALKLFGNKPRYTAIQHRGMGRDFSWRTAASGYETLYRDSL